jgi:hypothetical protein
MTFSPHYILYQVAQIYHIIHKSGTVWSKNKEWCTCTSPCTYQKCINIPHAFMKMFFGRRKNIIVYFKERRIKRTDINIYEASAPRRKERNNRRKRHQKCSEMTAQPSSREWKIINNSHNSIYARAFWCSFRNPPVRRCHAKGDLAFCGAHQRSLLIWRMQMQLSRNLTLHAQLDWNKESCEIATERKCCRFFRPAAMCRSSAEASLTRI